MKLGVMVVYIPVVNVPIFKLIQSIIFILLRKMLIRAQIIKQHTMLPMYLGLLALCNHNMKVVHI